MTINEHTLFLDLRSSHLSSPPNCLQGSLQGILPVNPLRNRASNQHANLRCFQLRSHLVGLRYNRQNNQLRGLRANLLDNLVENRHRNQPRNHQDNPLHSQLNSHHLNLHTGRLDNHQLSQLLLHLYSLQAALQRNHRTNPLKFLPSNQGNNLQ